MSVISPVLCRRTAMNTWFEIILLGDDLENLQAAGEAALDEVERIEKLLSRFDPTSEVSRINRDAALRPVLVDVEMAEILKTCLNAWRKTNGYFDIAAESLKKIPFQPYASEQPVIGLDSEARLVGFQNPNVQLDFGAFGKGYALDCAARLLREFGIQHALLHGGTSSVLAIGTGANNEPWRVGLRESEGETEQVQLVDLALSTSATGTGVSDILDPHLRAPLVTQASCTVIAETAAEAEIFSTALLCMGKMQSALFAEQNKNIKFLWQQDTISIQTYDIG